MTDDQKPISRDGATDPGADRAGHSRNAWNGEEAKQRLSDDMKRVWAVVWKHLKKYASVPFVVMLLLSTILWYAKKLGHTYQTEVPITVNVAGRQFEVNCLVEGQGTRLFAGSTTAPNPWNCAGAIWTCRRRPSARDGW